MVIDHVLHIQCYKPSASCSAAFDACYLSLLRNQLIACVQNKGLARAGPRRPLLLHSWSFVCMHAPPGHRCSSGLFLHSLQASETQQKLQELQEANVAASTTLQEAQQQHEQSCGSLAGMWEPLKQHGASLKAAVDSLLDLLPSRSEFDDAGAALVDLRKFTQVGSGIRGQAGIKVILRRHLALLCQLSRLICASTLA